MLPPWSSQPDDLGQLAGEESLLDAPGERELLFEAPPLGGLQGEGEVPEVEGRDRGEGDQKLQILLRKLPRLHPGFEDDQAERPFRIEERRGHEAPDAGEEHALSGREPVVGLDVEHQGRHPFFRDLADEAPGDADLVRNPGGRACRRGPELAIRALEQDRAAVGLEMVEDPVQDQLQKLRGVRDRPRAWWISLNSFIRSA